MYTWKRGGHGGGLDQGPRSGVLANQKLQISVWGYVKGHEEGLKARHLESKAQGRF